MSYSVVVEQIIGLYFGLCLDRCLAVSLHTAVITSVIALTLQDKSTTLKETYCVYKNTFAFLLSTIYICGQICILLEGSSVFISWSGC